MAKISHTIKRKLFQFSSLDHIYLFVSADGFQYAAKMELLKHLQKCRKSLWNYLEKIRVLVIGIPCVNNIKLGKILMVLHIQAKDVKFL